MRDFLTIFPIILAVSSPVLIIVFVVHYFRYRSQVAQQLGERASEMAASNRELEREVAKLRERVEVLEAIVTDSRHDLGRRISNL